MHDTMTDHLAKTRAQLEACAKRGQWDHVMAIGGYKSRDAAKSGMGYTILDADPVIEAPARHKPLKAYPEPKSVHCPRTGAKITPAPREWASEVRQRVAALSMSLAEFSALLGKSESYMSNCLGPRGHCPHGTRIQIEAQIIRLEKIEGAE